ncbi:hypothetical protein BC939DRAFT_478349 [Gamsiella multidivaricata]|uniref:uncharacterized protein n=1 Tax=Gamsiella multidivaricata TaxID=101098 RepID=UPI00221F58C4|nr:uncharacterized protein BC939DRAFT_478349 [Gamsiella multidivaricata]KAI7821366.1 hypothetical protein BC939DRAFT_478349 [Gamsiella multidivaricata]
MSITQPFTPPPTGSLAGRHAIYRGLRKSSMEYTSLTHSRYPESAHMLKGEILISGQQSGYIQYTIVLDHEWMTRKVKMSSMFGNQEKRLVLEVDQDQRWYKVTEHRLARTRSFYRSGLSQSQATGSRSSSADSQCSMQDADASLSDSSASCYSSSSDSECSIPFEKINLTWTPPPKGTKRASKRFSSLNPLASKATIATATATATVMTTATTVNSKSIDSICASPTSDMHPAPNSTLSSTISSPMTVSSAQASSPVVGFGPKTLNRTISTSSLTGPKKYEHLPQLDGCINLDLGYDVSPSTLLFPLKRMALCIEPEKMREHLESIEFDESTTEKSALVSFPTLELRSVQTHVAFAGHGHKPNFSVVECWREEEEDSTLVEVDGDGLVVWYGHHWARIPSS